MKHVTDHEYEAAKFSAIRAVKANPALDTEAAGFASGFILGFRAAWDLATPAPVETQEKGDQ